MRELLLCPPDHFCIDYEINPWMKKERKVERDRAQAQWTRLRDTLQALGSQIHLLSAPPGQPDAVFTANAGLVVGRRFIRSHFRHPERRGESAFFEPWFAQHGYELVSLPHDLFFEGEGDALFCGDVLFCGYRFRSDIRSHRHLGDLLRSLVISVELADDRFYHLDTCFCPLPDGGAIWFPPAFDVYAQRAIRHHVSALLEVAPEEAACFACNAVVLDQDVVLPEGCPKLSAALAERGYRCHPLPMNEFLKSGGACKCLTLFLPQRA
jgi:N-dimethylarginine dimethylaminohydrolase